MGTLKPKGKLEEIFSLLEKGGEMGKAIISKDWSESSLGSIDNWPSELITSLGILLYSPTPMFLLWGPLFIFFFNDAYRHSANCSQQEIKVLGVAVKTFPREFETDFQSMQKGTIGHLSKWSEKVSNLTKWIIENFCEVLSLSPVPKENGEIAGVLAICNDSTYPSGKELSKKKESLIKEERLQLAVEASEIAIWEMNLQTYTITYSDKLSEILGHDISKKITIHDIRNQVYPSDRQIVKDALADAMKNAKYKYEVRMVKPDNTIIYIRVKGMVFYDESGKPEKLFGTTRDITAERMNRKALERSERRLRRLILNAPIAIGILNGPDYIVEIINELALKLMGKTKEQMLNKPVLDSITELDPKAAKSLLDSVYYSGKPFSASEFPVRLNRFGKLEKVFLNFEYHPLFDGQEKVYGIMVVGIDVTDQVIARKKIEESEARFKLLADSMPQFVWSADEKGNINYFNHAVYDYSGLTEQQVKNGVWLEIVHPDERSQTIKKWKKSVITGKDFTFEHRFKRFDGQYRWQLSRAVSLRDKSGKIQQWIGTSTDIQNMKLQEQHKDFFISMASHELKTPITSMKGYVQILQSMYKESEDEFLKKSLDRIIVQIEKLISIIGELLDVSKIRSGSLTFNKQDFKINFLVKEIIEELEMIYPSNKIIFKPENDLKVYGDRDRIGQVLINLITNAIKYSPKNGDIIITSKVNQKSLVISVKDEGIGIDKNFQRKIFERFYRVEGKSEKTFPGFGIGLFIASEIIRRHRGNISVESEPGKGSRFYFSLPLAKR